MGTSRSESEIDCSLTRPNTFYLILDESRTRIDSILVLNPVGAMMNGSHIKLAGFVATFII